MAADKDDVTSAAKKLAAADNYSWTITTEGGQRNAGPSQGKFQKDGLTWIQMAGRNGNVEGYVKAGKGVIKTEDGWQSLDDAAAAGGGGGGGGGGGPRMMAMRLRTMKAPAALATDLVALTKDLAKSGDAYTGALTEEGAKAQLTMGGGRRGGGEAPTVANPKGSVKFWIKDGTISKIEVHVSGTVSFNGNDRDVDRTTTTEIKDIGTTKITVPDEAKSKMS
jgi:hypothetical protein